MGPIWPCFIDLIDLTDLIGPIDPRNLTDLIDLTDRPHFHLQCMCFGAHSGAGQFKDLRDFVGLIDLIVTLLLAQLGVTSNSSFYHPAPVRGWVRLPVGAQVKTHMSRAGEATHPPDRGWGSVRWAGFWPNLTHSDHRSHRTALSRPRFRL